MKNGDTIFVWILSAVFIIWILAAFRRWILKPLRARLPVPIDETIDDEYVEMLMQSGYKVFAGKKRVPITVYVNDQRQLNTRIFIDYFARKDDETYIVKLSKHRKPLSMTGSGIREALLSYYLLYDNIDGVLYIDREKDKVIKIIFDIDS